jgi:hypothetical protein
VSPFMNEDHYAEHKNNAYDEVNRSHISVFPLL